MPNYINCIPLERPEVQQELDRMEVIVVISKVDLLISWCADIVVIQKKKKTVSKDLCGRQA